MKPNLQVAPYREMFSDRQNAGERLARVLAHYKNERPLVLAFPAGGVVVGCEIAKVLNAPLDALFVRKLRAPESSELALGFVVDALGSDCILDESVIEKLGIAPEYIDSEVRIQLHIIEEHKRRYRENRPPLPVTERMVILADDGSADLPTIEAAITALALVRASSIVVATPVARYEVVQALSNQVDDVVCLLLPADLHSTEFYYADFASPTDEKVVELLRKGGNPATGGVPRDAMRLGL